MIEKNFLTAKDVATILNISTATAYRKIKLLNEELRKKGKIVIAGKISRRYFEERTYI